MRLDGFPSRLMAEKVGMIEVVELVYELDGI